LSFFNYCLRLNKEDFKKRKVIVHNRDKEVKELLNQREILESWMWERGGDGVGNMGESIGNHARGEGSCHKVFFTHHTSTVSGKRDIRVCEKPFSGGGGSNVGVGEDTTLKERESGSDTRFTGRRRDLPFM